MVALLPISRFQRSFVHQLPPNPGIQSSFCSQFVLCCCVIHPTTSPPLWLSSSPKSIWDDPECPLVKEVRPHSGLLCTHQPLAGCEVPQGTAAGLQGEVFLGRAQQGQVGFHGVGMAQQVYAWRVAVLWHRLIHIKQKLRREEDRRLWMGFILQTWMEVCVLVDAHLLLNLAAPGAEASNRGAFLTPELALDLRIVLVKGLWGLLLQLVGQVVEDACTALHRLEERNREVLNYYRLLWSKLL